MTYLYIESAIFMDLRWIWFKIDIIFFKLISSLDKEINAN